jgi:hypothetical protein
MLVEEQRLRQLYQKYLQDLKNKAGKIEIPFLPSTPPSPELAALLSIQASSDIPDAIKFVRSNLWSWDVRFATGIQIPAGSQTNPQVVNLVKEQLYQGYIYLINVSANNSGLLFDFSLNGNGGTFQIFGDYTRVLDRSSASGLSVKVIRYDTANNFYVAEMAPGFEGNWGIPFSGQVLLQLVNPTPYVVTYNSLVAMIKVKLA